MPRPRKYATDAERLAAFRDGKSRLDLVIPKSVSQTIEELAILYGVSKQEVANSLLKFALTNRNWKTQGLVWGRE